MPLDAARAAAKITAINNAFASIGTSGDTKMPVSKKNTEPVAYEFYTSAHLARIAEARKKKAHAAAVKAGVIFDHEKDPQPIGSNTRVYAGDVIEIACSVTTPATRLDADAFVSDLEKAGVKLALLNRLRNKHTHENRAPHKFTASIATL